MAYRPGDTGLDHNLPLLDRAFKNMSLNETEPKPKEYPPKSFGYLVNESRLFGLPRGGKKIRYTNKKRKFSKLLKKQKPKTNKRHTKRNI